MDTKLQEYAKLLIEVGLNVQKGQTLIISSPVECASFARLCADAAYDAGCREVIMNWSDDYLSRQKFLRADASVFDDTPEWREKFFTSYAEMGAAYLAIAASDPETLKGVDPDRLVRSQKSGSVLRKTFDRLQMSNGFPWCIASVPIPSWAATVFPELPEDQAMEKLWDAILRSVRIQGDGTAVSAWRQHLDTLGRRKDLLNKYHFKYLHYTNSLGTDLTIQLPEDHLWAAGNSVMKNGVEFVANMPTEEIFTAPLKTGINGVVYSAMPLVDSGNIIDKFYFIIRDGKIVEAHAEKGEEFLKAAISVDEGASYFGEVALVPYDSPISNQKILFYNTLFDENAACHIAFGDSYPGTTVGGTGLTREQLALLPAEQVAGVSRAQLLLAVYTRASEQLDTWLKNDKASYADVAQRLERLADSVRQELERSVDRDSAAKALDHYCGGSVEVLISSIGTVKPVMPPTEAAAAKTRLQRARTAYNALTASQKALVPNYASLQEGETAYRTYESNYAAAKAAESLISAIGTVTADSGDAIRKAQEAYDALTAEQKQLVDARLVQQMKTAAAQYRQLLAQSAENGGETPSADETMSDGVKPADRMQPTDQTRPEQAQPFDWSLVWLGGGILASAAAITLILRWLAAVRRTEKKNKA